MWFAPVILSVAIAGLGGQQSPDAIRQAFLQRVDEYATLHRRLEAPLPREVVTARSRWSIRFQGGVGGSDPPGTRECTAGRHFLSRHGSLFPHAGG